MPIYEYACSACGHEMEAMHKMSDAPLTECPACHQPQLTKLVSASGFRLKGGGWYETDFKGGSKKNLAASESKSEAAAAPAPCGKPGGCACAS
jgi:putative FmdB family regulatory protein